MGENARPSGSGRRVTVALDVALLVGLVAVALFPIAAVLSTHAEGVPPPPITRTLPPLQRTPTASLRSVPAFTEGGDAAKSVAEGNLPTDVHALKTPLDGATRALFATTAPKP